MQVKSASKRERTRPSREQTRRRVLDAAFAVFGEGGIAASSLDQVAAAAGLTKGAVYSNFASKDDLVLALMEEHAARRIDVSLAGFQDSSDHVAGLIDAAAVMVREMHADEAWHRLLAEFFAMAHQDPQRQRALRDRRREVREALSRVLSKLSEELDVELPLPPDDFAAVLLGLSNGLAMESHIDPEAVPDDLMGRVLTLLAGDAMAKVQARTANPAN